MAAPVPLTPGGISSLPRGCNLTIFDMLSSHDLSALDRTSRTCHDLVHEMCRQQFLHAFNAGKIEALGERNILDYLGIREALLHIPISIRIPSPLASIENHWKGLRARISGSVFIGPRWGNHANEAAVMVFVKVSGKEIHPETLVAFMIHPTRFRVVGYFSDGATITYETQNQDLLLKLEYCADLLRGRERGLLRDTQVDGEFNESPMVLGEVVRVGLDRPREQQPHLVLGGAAPAAPAIAPPPPPHIGGHFDPDA